ncbi:hypothetical protein ACQ4PT_003562 [Festuca glaucescens]
MADQHKVSTAIVAESEERSFVFKVHGYSRAKELFKNGECVASPPFSVGGDNWVLKYYPNGRSALSAAYIFLLLHSVDGKDVNAEARSIRVLGKHGLPLPVAQDMDQHKVSAAIAAESEERSFVFKVHGYSRLKELLKNGQCVASPLSALEVTTGFSDLSVYLAKMVYQCHHASVA